MTGAWRLAAEPGLPETWSWPGGTIRRKRLRRAEQSTSRCLQDGTIRDGHLGSARLPGKKPDKPDGVARPRTSASVYDQIELAAAVICDPRAPQILTENGLGVYFRYDAHAEVKWAAEGSLDFAYIAYFHYIMQLVREAETRASTRFTSLDMVWFRFFNPRQVEHPDYPPLPPMVVVEDVGELVNDLMRLAVMGILP